MDALRQLQNLLRELFQLDLADLDFGLYRLLHLKRNEVEAFLTEQLPNRVKKAFQQVAGDESATVEKELSQIAERIREEIADDALLESGQINPEYQKTKVKKARTLLQEYQGKREQLKTVLVTEAQQTEVYNHLYAFFSRYYEAGDFIPRRRYGAREAYAAPYNGEETFFHWANKDQHYVKTGESFRDYAFSVDTVTGTYRVRFVLTEASLPPGNTKGDTRYFFPIPDQEATFTPTPSLSHQRERGSRTNGSSGAHMSAPGGTDTASRYPSTAGGYGLNIMSTPLVGGDISKSTAPPLAGGDLSKSTAPPPVRGDLSKSTAPPLVGGDKGEGVRVAGEFRLPFHYRLPTEQEVIAYGRNSRLQEGILQNTLPRIMETVPDPVLQAALSTTVEQKDDQEISLLLKRLRHFCRRNTTDYFIHKNLEGFLKQELEFYLKDQVIHLADLEGDLDGKLRTLRVIRQLAEEITTFLAQIEEVEKRLFEKHKFVLRTDYLVPIKEAPQELWKEIIENREQVEAWKALFAIEPEKNLFNEKGEVNLYFLEQHPTLVVNTAHFKREFKERLLQSFDDLDEATDGLLVHSENYQALRFLERKYAGKVKCIYTDPPYNTGSDEFIYKDRYRHSSWLAMMDERLRVAARLLHKKAILMVSCDDNELERLRLCVSAYGELFGLASILVWKSRLFTDARPTTGISRDHEYVVLWGVDPTARFRGATKDILKYSNPDNDPRGPWTSCSLLGKATKARRPNLHYPFENSDTGQIYESPPNTGWICAKDTMLANIQEKRILWPKKLAGRPRLKVYLLELKSDFMGFPSIIDDVFTSHGTVELRELFGAQVYSFPKPSNLVSRLIEQASDIGSTALDFFSGSGCTGHAVINLNREDGGKRKFILVEMGQYFDDLILQRIQRAMYAPVWKDCKPKRSPSKEEVERSPRLVKVLRLEGYEDALHNLVTEETLKREGPRAEAHKKVLGEDAYRLSYLVRLPLDASATMLNLSALEHPFDYTLEVLTENGPRVETVDLVETFNYLYGLHVERLETWMNPKDKRAYKVVKARDGNRRRVLVLWRDMEGFDPVVERQFLEKKFKAEDPFDEMLINGDTATPGAKSLDALFKGLLMEGER